MRHTPLKYLIYLHSLLLFSCNSSNTKNNEQVQKVNAAKVTDHILLSNNKTHCFSDSIKKDTFRLILTGDSLMTAKAVFSIISYQGIRIYADTFSGSDLTRNVDGDPVIPDKEKIVNIKKSVRSFFNERAFSKPPIFHNDGNETTYWDQIKSDKTAVGFEEIKNHTDFRIAYSKEQHKVLKYWNDDEVGD